MNAHVKVVAILHIAAGLLSLIGAVAIFTIFGVIGGIVISQGERQPAAILGIIAMVICGFLTFVSLPGIIGGWGLLAQKGWARVLVMILGILHLLNFPFGTALGIYTLWVLLNDGRFPPSTRVLPSP